MSFIAPAALALAVLAVPIIAMYILKMRRPARVVPSTFLWEPVLRDMQANAPWQRLRANLLLLLQLLALAALVLALARPFVLRAAAAQGDVVAVLDGSALMQATDVAPSRFAAAKARIGALIDGLGSSDVMSIVLMARHAQVLIAQSADRSALHAALDAAAPTDESPDPSAALSVATALARGGRHSSIFVYTAKDDPAVSIPTGLPATTHVIPLGGTLRDLGIVSFAATRADDGTISVLTRVANLGQRAAASDVQIDAATGDPARLSWRDQVDLHPISLAPGASTTVYTLRLPGDIVAVRAHLTGGDDLAADDAAAAVVDAPAPRRVLLDTPGNPFLRQALALAPRVTLDTITPDQYSPARARGADLVVFDTVLPAALPGAPVLAVAPPVTTTSPLGLAVAHAIPATGLQAGDDPAGLLRYAGVNQVAVNQASPLSVPRSWAYAVLRTRGQAVMVAGQNGTRREAVLGFGLYNTDWALQVGFPIFIQNLLAWLAPPLAAPTGIYRPGDAVPLSASPGASALSVIDPSGRRTRVAPPFPAQTFVETAQPGFYTVEEQTPAGTRRALFAVNAFPLPPSGGASAASVSGAAAPSAGKAQVPLELAPFVAAVALLVLMSEWWVAARRR